MLRILTLTLLITNSLAASVQKAVAKVDGDVKGIITFVQTGKEVHVTGELNGLKPGKHGFHIHVFGDLSKGCTSAGTHFNPYNKTHGDISVQERHVGDLGNIDADDRGIAKVDIKDTFISLNGVTSIIGRAVVVHVDVDDLGTGGQSDSLTTGHAGGRAGCGVIGIAS